MGSGGPGPTEERESVTKAVPLESVERVVKADSIEGTKTWAGIILCYVTIGLIGLESLIMIIYFFAATYSLKSLGEPLTQDSIRAYKEARAAVVDDVVKISDQILGKLLPVLTLLLGYVFGAREERAEIEEGD